MKDFRSYGGGVPNYFELMKYSAFVLLLFTFAFVIYHLYVIQISEDLIKNDCKNKAVNVEEC
jgi:hypothetical protein